MNERTLPYWRQHYTARIYMKPWTNHPVIKNKEKVWAFRVTGQCQWEAGEEKLVGDIAWEPDLYSLYGEDESRNISYEEEVFGRTERDYAELKQLFDNPGKLLVPTNRKKLARFAAYQVLKVPIMFSSYRAQIAQIIQGLDERNISGSDLLTLEILNKSGVKTQHSVDEARNYLKGNGFEHFSVPRLNRMHSTVKKMKLLLVTFTSLNTLITSATPAILRLFYYGAHWLPLEAEDSQLVLPLTPSLLAVFNWKREGIVHGDAKQAMDANVLQVRNARGILIAASDTIDPEIRKSAFGVPEARDFLGFRGHLDPVPEDVRNASPMFFEAEGSNVKNKLFEVWPDGTTRGIG